MSWKNTGMVLLILILLSSVYFISARFIDKNPETISSDTLNFMVARPYPIPKDLVFAGEKMPMNDIDLRERYDREIMSIAYFHSSTLLWLKKSGRWFPLMKPVLDQYGIPADFLFLPVVESGLSNMVSLGSSGSEL